MGISIKKQLTQNEISAISMLLSNDQPLLVSSGILSAAEYERYFTGNINDFLSNDKKNCLLFAKTKRIRGVALLRLMEWDSIFFGMPVGRIDYILVDRKHDKADTIEMELLRDSINRAKEIGIKILYAPVISSRYTLISSLNSSGFIFICAEMEGVHAKKDFSFLRPERRLEDKYEFRRYKEDDYPQVLPIAAEIAEDLKNKLSLNPYLPQEQKNNYYLESIRNCCLGINADDTFVAARNGIIRGLISYRSDKIFEKLLKTKMSFLVIGGILRSERKKNLGRHFFSWAHRQIFKKTAILHWKAGLHNLPMLKFILKRGFSSSFGVVYTFCKKI